MNTDNMPLVQEIAPMLVTAEIAKEWLRVVPDNPRTISDAYVRGYVDLMTSGEFDGPGSGTIVLSDQRGDTVVIDGRHRLMALVKCGITQKLRVERRDGYTMHALMVDRSRKRATSYVLQRNARLTALATLAFKLKVGGARPPRMSEIEAWCDRLEGIIANMSKKVMPFVATNAVRLAAALATREVGERGIERYNSMFAGTMDGVTTRLYRQLVFQQKNTTRLDDPEQVYRAYAHFAAKGESALSGTVARAKIKEALLKW